MWPARDAVFSALLFEGCDTDAKLAGCCCNGEMEAAGKVLITESTSACWRV